MKMLIIGHCYSFKESRKKILALSKHASIDLVIPNESKKIIFGTPASVSDEYLNGKIFPLNYFDIGNKGTKYILSGLFKIIFQNRYDIILVEAEPWSWIKLQALVGKIVFSNKSILGEFSWENIERRGIKKWVLHFFYWLSKAFSDFVIVGSKDSESLLISKSFDPKKILVIPQFGIDPEKFNNESPIYIQEERKTYGLTVGDFVIGYLGRLVEYKGIHDLIHACVDLQKVHTNLKLVIKGDGELKNEIQKLEKLHQWIKLAPPCSPDDSDHFMKMIDLLVLPSRTVCSDKMIWKEQFGHVLIEAMACKTLVIGSNSGAIPEVIGNAEFIFKEGNSRDLSKRIQKAISLSESEKECEKDRIRERVLQYYSHERVAEKMINFFDKLRKSRP